MMQEPWVSAVVTLSVPANDLASISPAKGHFTSAGFEVHAPLGATFAIAGPKSLFEKTFGRDIVVNDQDLISTVTTAETHGSCIMARSLPDGLLDLAGLDARRADRQPAG